MTGAGALDITVVEVALFIPLISPDVVGGGGVAGGGSGEAIVPEPADVIELVDVIAPSLNVT